MMDGELKMTCNVCNKTGNKDEFKKDGRLKNGVASICLECQARAAKKKYWENPGVAVQRARDQRIRKKNGEQKPRVYCAEEVRERWKRNYKNLTAERKRARWMMSDERTKRGLQSGQCEVCGAVENVDGHHDDYTRPLEVRWLCRKHHRAFHAQSECENDGAGCR